MGTNEGGTSIQGRTSQFLQNESDPLPEIRASFAQQPIPASFTCTIDQGTCRRLEEMEEARKKRNERRREKRQRNPEQNVSDDEDDVLSAILGRRETSVPGESPRMDVLPSSTPAGQYIITEQEAQQNSFVAQDTSIPEQIVLLVKCHRSPPLSLFTPPSLDRVRAGRDVKYIKAGTGEYANTKLLDVSDFPTDMSLDFKDWTQAYNTFLGFLSTILEPKVLSGFLAHYDGMLKDRDLSLWFSAYRTFDERLRQRFFTAPFIIDPDSIQYHSALQDAKNLDTRQQSPNASVAMGGSSRYHPYPGRGKSFRPSRPLCLRCGGSDGHRFGECRAQHPVKKGRNFAVQNGDRGLERLSDKLPVCIRYNIGVCSTREPGSSHPVHMCSLCGDAGHPAIGCTRN